MAYNLYGSGVSSGVTGVKYGLLYNWYAATDPSNITANGWRVPGAADFSTLCYYLDPAAIWYRNVAGAKLKETGFTYWSSPNTGATNISEFNAKGAGFRTNNGSPGTFTSLNLQTRFWQTEAYNDASHGRLCYISYDSCTFNTQLTSSYYGDWNTAGNSIRIVKISTGLSDGQTSTYTGNDGKVYRTICIGNQEWLADNLAETKWRTGQSISQVTLSSTWFNLKGSAMCAYNNDWNNVFSYADTNARIYNFNSKFLVPRGTAGGTISLTPQTLSFYSNGSPYSNNYTTVTSTTLWTARLSYDPDGVINSYTTSGNSGNNCTISCSNMSNSQSLAMITFQTLNVITILNVYVDGSVGGDSISLSIITQEFDWDGTPFLSSNVTVTSSGSWTSSYVDMGSGTTWAYINPTSYSGTQTITTYCDMNYGGAREMGVYFQCGTANATLTISQYSM